MPLSIARVETFVVDYPTVGRFKFFTGRPGYPPGRATVVVRLTADDGSQGWGQTGPSPRWSYETLETIRSTIDLYLSPELIGGDANDVGGLMARLHRAIAPSFSTGQPIAKAAIDLALLDLLGRHRGESAVAAFGASRRDVITLSWTLNPADEADLEASLVEAAERGYRHFNLKVAPNVETDVRLARRIRELKPDAHVWVDANGGYDLDTARIAARRFADLGVAALEQPLPANRLDGYRQLRKLRALPILMDEGIVSAVELDEFARLGMLDGVALKVTRSGGLTESFHMAEVARSHGLTMYGSGLTDPDLALAASLLLFAVVDMQFPVALNGPQFLNSSILRTPLAIHGDQATVPSGPGLGVDVDETLLILH